MDTQAKYLGMTIDGNLTWVPYLDNISKKLNTGLKAIRILQSRESCREALKAQNILTLVVLYIQEVVLYVDDEDLPKLNSIHQHNTGHATKQIYDKFPEKKGGLKELYDKGPQSAFFLVKFWADLNTNIQDEAGAFYGVTSQYESNENMTITCSTKVCSFGKQVVEKVETEYARFENGRFVYRIHRSPMCEYMINFILKLKHLPEKYMMNSVLENFTILQVVTNRDTQETLLCTAYVFEVSTSEHGAQHHIYRLIKD
ncbi:Transcriptional enhancer factor TEF-1 [Homalodisca vitripennis]|nr:Transcriptional enhancer factor TEF-1 [Homalodisca vitripennis]